MAATPSLPEPRLETRLVDKKPLLTLAEARTEADRCLYCADAPCIQACPTSIDVPTFIKKIASGNVRGSAQTILEQNLLGYSCARVCPVEVLCEGSCVYTAWQKKPIAIGRLQRFATEMAGAEVEAGTAPIFAAPKTSSGRKVAIIGAGPASLACAGTLALAGHKAVIFEGRAVSGGLNTTGIAPYKMHADDALAEARWVASLGDVEIRTGEPVTSAADLLVAYDAVFVGVGLGADTPLGVPGEAGPGVVGATAWIERMKLETAAANGAHGANGAGLGRVVVIGGGNTAIDVARECAQLGAREVTMAYRRGEDAMSAYRHELDAGRKEGVRIVHHAQPAEILRAATGEGRADGPVIGVRFARTDVSYGANVTGAPAEAFDIPADLVVLAIGQAKLRDLLAGIPGVVLDERGRVVTEAASGRTGHPRVYAGGDCVNGGKEVVNAVADGRDAARAMNAAFAAST
jgi:dihydropyrimidine dehydrogenase (NAD+) subunit PreT